MPDYVPLPNERLLDELLRVTDILATDMAGFLSRHGLNTAKAHVLWSLRASGPQMQRWLSDELGYSPRHVTTLVDDLIALDLVERTAHLEDRRAVLVTLTAAGSDLVASFEADRSTLADQLFGRLDAATKGQLAAILHEVSSRLAAAVDAAGAEAAEVPVENATNVKAAAS